MWINEKLTQFAHESNVLEVARVGASKNDHDTDGILVNELDSVVRIQNEAIGFLYGNKSAFNVEVPM